MDDLLKDMIEIIWIKAACLVQIFVRQTWWMTESGSMLVRAKLDLCGTGGE